MKLTLLGTGTPIPDPNRGGTSLAVESDDETVLIDCGPGTTRALTANGIDLVDVETVFFTHEHPDHNAGFLDFAATGWILGRRSLTLYGPAGTERYPDALARMYEHYFAYLRERDGVAELRGLTDVDCRRVEAGFDVETDGWRVRALPVVHSIRTCAYRFTERSSGASLVYTGDTKPIPELPDFVAGADVLVHEATLDGGAGVPDDPEGVVWEQYADPPAAIRARMGEMHSTAEDAGELAAEAGVGTLVLTHLTPYQDAATLRSAAEAVFGGRVVVAEDGTELAVG